MQGHGCHPEGPRQAGRMSEQESYEIQQWHTQSTGPGKEESPAMIQAENCSSEKDEELNISMQCALAAKVANSMLAYIHRSTAIRPREAIVPSAQLLWDHTWNSTSSFGLPNTRRTSINWSKFSRGTPRWLQDWRTYPVRRGWRSWACPVWRSDGFWGDLTAACLCLIGGHQRQQSQAVSSGV